MTELWDGEDKLVELGAFLNSREDLQDTTSVGGLWSDCRLATEVGFLPYRS